MTTMTTRALPGTVLLIVFSLTSLAAACGDDSDDSPAEAGSGGQGGTGGKSAGGKGGGGGNGGREDGTAGVGGKSGTGGVDGGGEPQNMCTEEPPTQAVKCGGETCVTPMFETNPCVVACCLEINGQSKCGAKSTSNMFPAACTLLADPDPACPAVENMPGCCDHTLGKCGIVSSARPGCITQSAFVQIPNNTCAKSSDDNDAGEPDAG
jgi:hypothetical protein